MRIPDPTKRLDEQPVELLFAMLLFGEARGAGTEAMAGVANTIRNRMTAPRNGLGKRFGLGWSGIILHAGAFDCLKPTDPNYAKLFEPLKYESEQIWQLCFDTAAKTLAGRLADNTVGATHYHDSSVLPWWAKPEVIEAGRMLPTVQIGELLFYREP
jgi:hypothetical protein